MTHAEMDSCYIRSTIQDALLFSVVPEMRWLYYKVEEGAMSLSAAFDHEPTAHERQMLIDVATQAKAHFYADLTISVACYYADREITEYDHSDAGMLVYARFEGD